MGSRGPTEQEQRSPVLFPVLLGIAILMSGETLPPRVVRSDGYLQADTKHLVN